MELKDIATVKVAIEICHTSELKREILHECENKFSYNERRKRIIEEKATDILKTSLPIKLQEKVIVFVLLIGKRMRNWARYYEKLLGFSREDSVNFLNSSYFTHRGIIDAKKVTNALMNNKNHSVEQRFTLACLNCFTDDIQALHGQMTKEDLERLAGWTNGTTEPGLVKFWANDLMGKLQKLNEKRKPKEEYLLEKAIASGFVSAVKFCLEKTDLSRKYNVIIDAAEEAVRNRIKVESLSSVYRHEVYECTYVPGEYYTDILCFLLSRMSEDQQIQFLKKDIRGGSYFINFYDFSENHFRSRVLEYFLDWPYQNYFMKMARLVWEFLPEWNYAVLLLQICDRIEPGIEKHGEEKSYDYRGLLKSFWYQSPGRYKRYIFRNPEVNYAETAVKIVKLRAGAWLFLKLLTLKTFTIEDREMVEIILTYATDEEKERIKFSQDWIYICSQLVMQEKTAVAEWFEQLVFSSNIKH